MTKALHILATATRTALALVTLGVIVWSFGFVGLHWWREHAGKKIGGRTTLTLLYWGDADEERVMRSITGRYETEHPDVQIERIVVGAGDFQTKLRTMFAAGSPPDLFYLQPVLVSQLASMNLLRPLDDQVAAERAAGRGAWIDDFYPKLLSAFRYDGRRAGAGPLYGLPKDFTTLVMWVNTDLFVRAGVAVPYGGWTWDEYESAMKKITALSAPARPIFGGSIELWDETFRAIVWSFGGDFFKSSPDGTPDFDRLALEEPGAQAAMRMICRVRQNDKTVYNAVGVAKDDNESFAAGDVASIGPLGRWKTPQWRHVTAFPVDCVPLPHAAGVAPATELITNAWAISRGSRHPQEAFDLMRFLCGPDGQADAARLGIAIPSLKSVAESAAFLQPGMLPKHTPIFLQGIEDARIEQFPRQASEFQQVLGSEVLEKCLQLGTTTPAQAGADAATQWRTVLTSPLQREYPPMRWPLLAGAAGAAILGSVGVYVARLRRQGILNAGGRAGRAGWLFISPWLVGFAALTLGPMVVSLLLSVSKWTAMTPLGTAQFVGMLNYRQLLVHDPLLWQSLKVTFYYVVLGVPLAQAASFAVALMMNSRVRGITLFRTAYFVPSVVSGVALATLWLWMFNKDYGLINVALRPIASLMHTTPPDWFGSDADHFAIPAFIIMGLWGVGSGMVIYLAGLKGVPASLYEAATLDGAGPARRLWNVTIPMLSPLIFYNVVMGVIGSFQIFTQAKVMTNGGPNNATLFYVLDLYREAFEFQNMGYASAMAWLLFVIVLALTLVVFRASRGLIYYEGLKA